MKKFTEIFENIQNVEFKVEFVNDPYQMIIITDPDGEKHSMTNVWGINNINTALEFFLSDYLASICLRSLNGNMTKELKKAINWIENTNIRWHGRYKDDMEICMIRANNILNPIVVKKKKK